MADLEWNLAEAKSKLSELLNKADQRAQIIRRRGISYVVIRAGELAKLTGKQRGLVDHLLEKKARCDELEPMPRAQTSMRPVEL